MSAFIMRLRGRVGVRLIRPFLVAESRRDQAWWEGGHTPAGWHNDWWAGGYFACSRLYRACRAGVPIERGDMPDSSHVLELVEPPA